MIRLLTCTWALTLACASSALAQEPANLRLTTERLWELGRVGTPAVSPDGTALAWTVRRFDLAANAGRSDLLVCDLPEGEPRELLVGWKSIGDVQWIAGSNGNSLWFTGQRNAESPASPQAFRLDATAIAGESVDPRQVTSYDFPVANLKVSPNGQRIAFTRDIKLDPTVQDLYPDLPKADARIIDALMYRHWNEWHDFAYSHLHFADLQADGSVGPATDLMPEQRNDCPVPPFGGTEQFAWHPNSQLIAYTTKISETPAQSTDSSVWIIDVTDPSSARNVTTGRPGYDNDPFWSPDGDVLAFHSMVRPGFEADRNRVMLYEIKTGKLMEATEGLDQNALHSRFSPSGLAIVFQSEFEGTVQIYTRNSQGELRQLTSGDHNWGLVDLLPDGQQAVVTRQDMIRPDELFLLDLNTGKASAVSHTNDAIFATLELPRIERRIVTATDGKPITCWVALPPDFDPESEKKWPLLLYCQGGPQSGVTQFFSYRWNFHLMASQGYVVIAPNRRGLPGFGQQWNDQISGDWGGQAMQDLLSATDDISKEPWIDTQRRGAVGASFGGYTVYWLMGNHADRFQAMIAHCGVFNLESMYGSTEELFFVDWDLGGPYWGNAETAARYEQFSPHRFVRNWQTPLLVIHGEKDFRVPINQGLEAFTAAQLQKVPSRFLYFPGEGHWVMQPQNGVLWNRVFFEWLERFCPPGSR